MTWIDIDYLMNNFTETVYEPRTFEKYLMISKYQETGGLYRSNFRSSV
jgi:hypothetical protein